MLRYTGLLHWSSTNSSHQQQACIYCPSQFERKTQRVQNNAVQPCDLSHGTTLSSLERETVSCDRQWHLHVSTAKVDIFICSHLRKAKCVLFWKDRHMGELPCKRQAKKYRWMQEDRKKIWYLKFVSLELVFFTWISVPGAQCGLHGMPGFVWSWVWRGEISRICCVFCLQLCAWNHLRFHQMFVFQSQVAHRK